MNKKTVILSLACVGAVWSLMATPLKYDIKPDHTNHLYCIGETATFVVTVNATNGAAVTTGEVSARLDNFGKQWIRTAKWNLATSNVFKISGKLEEAGFLRLVLTAKDSKTAYWSVGYEPEKLRKGSPSPKDFDEFWAVARQKLAKEVPIDVRQVELKELANDKYRVYRISFATFGRRVHGYMSVPTKGRKPYPLDFIVNAAGPGAHTFKPCGNADRVRVQFSVYHFEPNWKNDPAHKDDLYNGMNADFKKQYGCIYSCAGISESRESYYFYPVILGIDRALDWAVALPFVDKRRVYYTGCSQGGGFGLYLCGLNHKITRATVLVPAITDTMGYLKGRQSGWPQIVENNSRTPEQRAAAEKNAPYFDAANFASRIQCPVGVVVGFADITCAPCAVYSAYNEIKAPGKEIFHGFGMPHQVTSPFYKKMDEWLHR